MTIPFDTFALAKKIHLTKSQVIVANLLIEGVKSEPSIKGFLSNESTGKRFLLALLKEYFIEGGNDV